MIDLSAPRRTSPLAAVFGLVKVNGARQILPIVVIGVSSGRFLLVAAVVGAVSLAYGTLTWLRRTWSFDGEVLHVDEGIFVRNQRRIPVSRVQHVEIERSLRHQLFGLAEARVETAGGSGVELQLDAIPLAEAEALQRALRPRVAAASGAPVGADGTWALDAVSGLPMPPPPPPPPAPVETLIKLPPSRLLLAGVTGPEVILVLTSVFVATDVLLDVGIDPSTVEDISLDTVAIVLLGLVAVPIWFVTAGLIALIKKWDLTATVEGDDLHVTYGLLSRRALSMPLARIQEARIQQRLVLRPFGRADVRFRSAASRGPASQIEIPLLDADEIDLVLARLLPAAVPRPTLFPAPPATRRRMLVRGGGVGAVLGALLGGVVFLRAGAAASSIGLVVPIVFLGLSELGYRALGWAEARGVHHVRSGVLGLTTAVVPVASVASASVTHSFFQRRRGLASAGIDLPRSRVTVADRDLAEACAIVAHVTAT